MGQTIIKSLLHICSLTTFVSASYANMGQVMG